MFFEDFSVSSPPRQLDNKQFLQNLKHNTIEFISNNLFKIQCGHLCLEKMEQNKVHKNILSGKFLSPENRVELRDLINQICAQNYLNKRTAALTAYYIDMSIFMGINYSLKKSQQFAIACLWIASKLWQSVDKQVYFSKAERKKLGPFEEQILSKLNYKLNPITQYEIGTQLVRLWADFQSASKVFYQTQKSHQASFMMVYVFDKCVFTTFSHHLFYELLQYAFHFMLTFNFQLDRFVFNTFYFVLCTQVYTVTAQVTQKHLKDYYSEETQMVQIMEIFKEFCQLHNYELSLQHDGKMQQYLCLIYNSLIKGFDPDSFQRDDIKKYDPNHWMWSQRNLYLTQTHFFLKKYESFLKTKDDVASFFVKAQEQKQLLSTNGTNSSPQSSLQSDPNQRLQPIRLNFD